MVFVNISNVSCRIIRVKPTTHIDMLCVYFLRPTLIWPIYAQLVSALCAAVQYNFPSDLGIIHLSTDQSSDSQPPTLYSIYISFINIIRNNIITTLLYRYKYNILKYITHIYSDYYSRWLIYKMYYFLLK